MPAIMMNCAGPELKTDVGRVVPGSTNQGGRAQGWPHRFAKADRWLLGSTCSGTLRSVDPTKGRSFRSRRATLAPALLGVPLWVDPPRGGPSHNPLFLLAAVPRRFDQSQGRAVRRHASRLPWAALSSAFH